MVHVKRHKSPTDNAKEFEAENMGKAIPTLVQCLANLLIIRVWRKDGDVAMSLVVFVLKKLWSPIN
jgi:hypothetical protein